MWNVTPRGSLDMWISDKFRNWYLGISPPNREHLEIESGEHLAVAEEAAERRLIEGAVDGGGDEVGKGEEAGGHSFRPTHPAIYALRLVGVSCFHLVVCLPLGVLPSRLLPGCRLAPWRRGAIVGQRIQKTHARFVRVGICPPNRMFTACAS